MPQPEMYIGNASNLFDGEGRLTSTPVKELLTKFLDAYAAWISRFVDP